MFVPLTLSAPASMVLGSITNVPDASSLPAAMVSGNTTKLPEALNCPTLTAVGKLTVGAAASGAGMLCAYATLFIAVIPAPKKAIAINLRDLVGITVAKRPISNFLVFLCPTDFFRHQYSLVEGRDVAVQFIFAVRQYHSRTKIKQQEYALKSAITGSLREAEAALASLVQNESALAAIESAATLISTFQNKGRVYACGNGGSMCDAMHFAEELTGRYRHDRAALPAIAISDPGHLTCVGNDYGYEQVFSRYLEAHGRAGDCLVAMTTSGSSKNIHRAARVARELGMSVIVLSGRTNHELAALSNVYVCTPAGAYADRVQELHIKVLHILIELIERQFFPANYANAT
jgi:D-sedoheptulose 7-phosphate isomerase